jgi:hypothetical protein
MTEKPLARRLEDAGLKQTVNELIIYSLARDRSEARGVA